MKTKTALLTFLVVLTGLNSALAQVGIGTTEPDDAAALDITAYDKGLLLPRMTENDRDNILNPPAGLMVWCSNCGSDGEMQVYNGTDWTNMIGGAAAVQPPPQIGDYRDGGVVFYLAPTPTDLNGDGTLDQGLVCAVSDQSTDEWFNGSYINTGATATGIGTGQSNTDAIITAQGAGTYAASNCDNYSVTVGATTYDDWFLPSTDELNEMYLNKTTINNTAINNGGSSFVNDYYWSSTDYSISGAEVRYFVNGTWGVLDKTDTYRIRAVRAF